MEEKVKDIEENMLEKGKDVKKSKQGVIHSEMNLHDNPLTNSDGEKINLKVHLLL